VVRLLELPVSLLVLVVQPGAAAAESKKISAKIKEMTRFILGMVL
jgi:hypothetical protein